MGADLLHVDGQTDMKLIVVFLNFAYAHKNISSFRMLGAFNGVCGLMSFIRVQLRISQDFSILVLFSFVYLLILSVVAFRLGLGYISLSGCVDGCVRRVMLSLLPCVSF